MDALLDGIIDYPHIVYHTLRSIGHHQLGKNKIFTSEILRMASLLNSWPDLRKILLVKFLWICFYPQNCENFVLWELPTIRYIKVQYILGYLHTLSQTKQFPVYRSEFVHISEEAINR